jgi:hypothetical protein
MSEAARQVDGGETKEELERETQQNKLCSRLMWSGEQHASASEPNTRIILMRNPGCQLENVPYTETHYAPADISDTSGDTKYRNSLTTQLASNHTHLPGRSPSPQRMWARSPTRLANVEAWILAASAPPLFRGMWAAPSRLTEKLGMEKREGGPRKWAAHSVRHEIRATTNVMARFHHVFSHSH